MAKFQNVSGIQQQISLPSMHLRGEGRWWDNDAPKQMLAPDGTVETSVEIDLRYLRELTRERIIHRRGKKQPSPGVLMEVQD